MRSYLPQPMDNYQGDLADVVRASGGAIGAGGAAQASSAQPDWQFPSSLMETTDHDFGDPFSNMRDPLLYELDIASSGFFRGPNSADLMEASVIEEASGNNYSTGNSTSIFSRTLQISPNVGAHQLPVSPCESAAAAAIGISGSSTNSHGVLVSNDLVTASISPRSCLGDATGGVQISSPRNPGIKRRKSQAKKVVCIPAPAPANSRPSSGEVVPSDLWAWRKYGQKPIKGSPYPRGYYRCSSSKGCSARKQVERSRTDPNMLVITYTSEHNHPWPTQRNALAGSTRSQPSKTNAASKTTSNPGFDPQRTNSNQKEDIMNNNQKDEEHNSGVNASDHILSCSASAVKEEMGEVEKQYLEMEDGEFGEGFAQTSYRPALPDQSNHQPEDFFADLGEIEADPLSNLLFTEGFEEDHEGKESKGTGMDPFSLFGWTGHTNSSSFGEAKRGL
ncbi:probable WRKY transcription factor 35 [Malania oleifera]|uniref:probable WRKY transcription factor 35 n=1 Tax=Malania oleifera TaxID=397392 RepID=UPI0025AEA93B|nr:probable WRKY transcription factor 35 [Malania oleifera]